MQNYDMFYDASQNIHKNANDLRKRTTNAEKLLWEKLRNRQLNGLKFRRQHPVSIFIADFYCHEQKLIIELDGEIHNTIENQEYDKNRTKEIEKYGIKVIRFKNEEIENNMSDVLKIIVENLT